MISGVNIAAPTARPLDSVSVLGVSLGCKKFVKTLAPLMPRAISNCGFFIFHGLGVFWTYAMYLACDALIACAIHRGESNFVAPE